MGLNGSDRDLIEAQLVSLLDEIDAPRLTRLAGMFMSLCRRRHRMKRGDPGGAEDYAAMKKSIAEILAGND